MDLELRLEGNKKGRFVAIYRANRFKLLTPSIKP